MDLTKGQERGFIELDSEEKKLAFLKQAKEEGFTIGGKAPTSCHCDLVMILHPDYTINYVVGAVTIMLYHSKQSVKVKYEQKMPPIGKPIGGCD